MNPVEEHRTDALAFLLMQRLNYFCMIRGMDAYLDERYLQRAESGKRRGSQRPTEIDLIGLRRDPQGYVLSDCFEVKVGAKDRDQRKTARKQAEIRRNAGCFRRVWQVWDIQHHAQTEDRCQGVGTIFVDAINPKALQVKRIVEATPLELKHGLVYERHRAAIREWANHHQRRVALPSVYLKCVKCGCYWYPFAFDVWNSHPEFNTKAADHSPFCPEASARTRFYVGTGFDVSIRKPDEEEQTLLVRGFNLHIR